MTESAVYTTSPPPRPKPRPPGQHRILVCGASGFVGRHIVEALLAKGHEVTGAGRSRLAGGLPFVPVDFLRHTEPGDWVERVRGFDVVVNAVGVLRGDPQHPMSTIHSVTPAAMFEACRHVGVPRIVQISALGIGHDDNDNATEYARTKRRAERALRSLPDSGPSWVALRPSVMLGPGGDAAKLFSTLARLPVLAMPTPALDARLQPLHVADLGQAVVAVAEPHSPHRGLIELAGPRPMTLAQLIAELRAARAGGKRRAAPVLRLPGWTGMLSSRAGDLVASSPWCTETRRMLETDNVASPEPLRELLGRAPRDLRDFAASL